MEHKFVARGAHSHSRSVPCGQGIISLTLRMFHSRFLFFGFFFFSNPYSTENSFVNDTTSDKCLVCIMCWWKENNNSVKVESYVQAPLYISEIDPSDACWNHASQWSISLTYIGVKCHVCAHEQSVLLQPAKPEVSMHLIRHCHVVHGISRYSILPSDHIELLTDSNVWHLGTALNTAGL